MLPSLPVSDQTDAFEEQLVKLLSRQPRRMLVPLFLSVLLIAGMAARTTPLPWILAWLGFALIVMLLRTVMQNPARLDFITPSRRLRLVTMLVGLSGATHGLSLFFFPAMSPFEQAVLSMMLVGMSAGAVATGAGYPPIFLAYIVPTLCPLVILWIVNPMLRDVGWIQGLMALLIALFAVVLYGLARDTFRVLRESYEIRLERASLNRELRSALDLAEAASRAKTRFLASASHDLRQPMQTLSLFAAALAMRPLDERSRNIADNMNAALHDLTAELDALLDVSKLDAGVVQPVPAPLPLRPLLARLEETFSPAARNKDVRFSCHCENDIWILTDRKLLERLLRNLVENAIKYTDAGSVTISATLEGDGERCALTISDTGRGIAPAEHERVFEEFYQIDNPGRDRTRGLGLGLSIVRRLADLLRLELSMTSALAHGTRFTVRLHTTKVTGLERAATPMRQMACPQSIRVLLIDDEESVRLGMQALLEELGCIVELAAGTTQALTICRQRPVDLLIADFRLRDNDDGISAIRAARQIIPGLPALLLTGETAPNRLREAQEAGIPVLHKPASAPLLVHEISKISPLKRRTYDGEPDARSG